MQGAVSNHGSCWHPHILCTSTPPVQMTEMCSHSGLCCFRHGPKLVDVTEIVLGALCPRTPLRAFSCSKRRSSELRAQSLRPSRRASH